MTTIDDIQKNANERMEKSLDALCQEFSRIRTGRAHPSLLEEVMVSYYGSQIPLNQIANITIQDARTLNVNAFDKNAIPEIEKSILNSELGLNPVTTNDNIHIPLPPLTEERRQELTRQARTEAEAIKVAIRNIRRDANNAARKFLKEKQITQDEDRDNEIAVQKLTDQHIQKVNKTLTEKQKEIMDI